MTYQNILTGVDTNEPCQNIIDDAATLAAQQNATHHLINVTPIMPGIMACAARLQEEMEQHAKKTLEESLHKGNHKATIEQRLGRPFSEVIDYANSLNADLIITGSHGKHGLARLMGSTANGIIHSARCDVLSFRVDVEQGHIRTLPYQRVLLATDFHHDSMAQKAKVLCDLFGAELHLINVIADGAALSAMMIPSLEIEEAIEQQARQKLTTLADKLSIPDGRQHLYHGIPKVSILDCANTIEADLIIVGKHGHHAIQDLIIGSTANALLHYAKQDILVMHVNH